MATQHRPLGRHVEHDPRSLDFAHGVLPKTAIKTVDWIRRAPIFDQGSLGSCHSADTEILTDRGWVAFPDLTSVEALATVDPSTGTLVYEQPTRLVAFPYKGEMHYASGRSKDFAVTPDHKMLVRPWDEAARTLSSEYKLVDAKDVGWYAGLMCSVDYRGRNREAATTYVIPGVSHKTRPEQRVDLSVPTDAWLRFLGLYLAEGTITASAKSPYGIQVAAVKEREKEFARQVFADLGIHVLELSDRFTMNHKQVVAELTRLGLAGVKAPQKFVPRFVFALPAEQIDALLLGHWMGDGCEQNGLVSHYTSSRHLADDLHELVFLSGKWGTVSSREPRSSVMKDGRSIQGRHRQYRVSCSPKSGLSLERKKDVRIEQYDGMVYCAEVPTYHTLVTRRNGKILISGNCTGNAAAGLLGTDSAARTGLTSATIGDSVVPVDEDLAVQVYELATQLDSITGTYPPDDTGSSGIGAAKALKKLGLATSYTHAFSLDALKSALQSGPVMAGTVWLESMFDTDSEGYVKVDRKSAVAGGHEYVISAWDAVKKRFRIDNSWGASWGLNGSAWIHEADMQWLLSQQGDVTVPAWVAAPTPTPVPTPPPSPAPAPDPRLVQVVALMQAWAHDNHVTGA